MRGKYRPHHILEVVLLFIALAGFSESNSKANEKSKYLKAVREFADNVLKYGRDTYGPKHTPLFVDGLNIHTHEPVKWISPKGDYSTATDTEEWILSNFASQQTLLRTLDGLSSITGDAKYRQAAMDAIKYAFDHVRTPSGLFYWGHMTAYDALGDTPRGNTSRESIKLHYPYYELMWTVDPDATKKLIEALWCAHVMDWSNLDFNRIGITTADQEEPWNHEYKGGPTFFKSKHGGGGFSVTATSLIQAGTTLYKLSHQEQPLVWSKRLAERFVDTRHPKTGIAHGLYNNSLPPLGDDLKEHFRDPHARLFPFFPFEDAKDMYWPENVQAHQWISLFLVGQMLGENDRQFIQWALEELTAWAKASYRVKDNSFVPIITDGTSIEGYVCQESGFYAPKGAVAKPLFTDLTFFWGYAVAYRTTGDKFMWQMVRDIALGNDLGDIGKTSLNIPRMSTDTICSDVYGLLGFLELYRKTKSPEFLEMAQCIGSNIVNNQFHKGFFLLSKKHIYTRFDCFEPLALLHLVATIESKSGLVPRIWPSCPLFVPSYRYKQEGVDRRIIYTLTESTEPPLSLQEAAAIGDVNIVQSLLGKGVGVDSWDDSLKKTALQCAAMSGHKKVLELLLAEGARIDAQEDFPGGTALDYAAENGHRDVAALLIAHGADVNAKRGYPAGDRPLHSAVRAGHREIIDLLIAKKADVNAKNEAGQTPLDIAVRQKNTEIVELLVEKGDLPLHVAAQHGLLEKLKELIEKEKDINAKDSSGKTPLHHAVEYGHKDIVELLIAKGADINVLDNDGNTPGHIALRKNDEAVLDLLIAKGANIVSIHLSTYQGDLNKVRSYIENGTDVNTVDSYGTTPLHYAARRGHKEVVEFLIAKGADVNAKDKSNFTPLHGAAEGGHKDVVALLIDNGANINARARWDYTPMYYAAWSGITEVVELLVEKGADVNANDEWGWTPLHYMANGNYRDMADFLIAKGADVNAEDIYGETPLPIAKDKGHTEIVELLRKHGAKE